MTFKVPTVISGACRTADGHSSGRARDMDAHHVLVPGRALHLPGGQLYLIGTRRRDVVIESFERPVWARSVLQIGTSRLLAVAGADCDGSSADGEVERPPGTRP